MTSLRSCVGWVALGIVLSAAGTARAETTVCAFRGTTADPPIVCQVDECTTSTECSREVYGGDVVCEPLVAGDDATVCRPACSTFFGCSADADCPPVAGTAGACVMLGSPAGGVTGLCVYPEPRVDYCAEASGAVLAHFVGTCHTKPSGVPTSNYFLGDCDGDGCPNGADPMPCVAGTDEVCGSVARGGACGPIAPPDAGVAMPDASIGPDAGEVEEDAGPKDGGVETQDDAGAPGMDATTAPPVSFHGGGGCTCSVGHRAAPWGPLSLAALALLGLRRRRSR